MLLCMYVWHLWLCYDGGLCVLWSEAAIMRVVLGKLLMERCFLVKAESVMCL